MKFLKAIALPLLMLTLIFSSCSKDDDDYEGKLSVTFANGIAKTAYIYSIRSDEYPVYTIQPTNNSFIKLSLNVGDYILRADDNNSMGFQIRQGKTTTITYDKNGIGKVTY